MPEGKTLTTPMKISLCSEREASKQGLLPGGVSQASGKPSKKLTEGEGGMFRENSIETWILSRVKQISSPGWMHETSARGWCTGKTQWDGLGKEAGGGIGMGNTCKSMADSQQCMAKPLQYCKVINLQLIKINEKIKKKVTGEVQ